MRTTASLLALLVALSQAGFIPNVRVDHENRPSHLCFHAAIAVGPSGPACQPVYVAFQNDSVTGIVAVRSDVYFQKSTDGGKTWLEEDRLIRRGSAFACYPDITTSTDGSIYIVYTERQPGGGGGHFFCVRSTDLGNTWSAPARMDDNAAAVSAGWARVAVDTGGCLFAAWNDDRTGYMHIWSSVSTDGGTTWFPNVRVDDDTVPSDCHHADVFVQPGTNAYLVTSSNPFWVRPGYISKNSVFTKSLDRGQTFSPCVVLDTFEGYCGQPHVVADAECIVCDYTGSTGSSQCKTESRTSANLGDTWGPPVAVTEIDTTHTSYLNGGKLAIDGYGGLHAGLMVAALANYDYNIHYAKSGDHGLSWSEREMVNDVTTDNQSDPDIAADSVGFAYLVWQDGRNSRCEIWFSTNNQVGLAEQLLLAPRSVSLACSPTHFSRCTQIRLSGAFGSSGRVSVFDPAGKKVRDLTPVRPLDFVPRTLWWDGTDDSGRRCASGVYVIRATDATAKVVLLGR